MTEMQKEKRKKIKTTKGYKEYQKILQNKEISKIMTTGNLQHQYYLWSQAIEETIKKMEKVIKKGHMERCKKVKGKNFKQKKITTTKNK